jgi:hypothetical protein
MRKVRRSDGRADASLCVGMSLGGSHGAIVSSVLIMTFNANRQYISR